MKNYKYFFTSIILISFCFFSCDDKHEIDKSVSGSITSGIKGKHLEGTWLDLSNNKAYYYFTDDGKLTKESNKSSEGFIHVDYNYTIKDSILVTKKTGLSGTSEDEYTISIKKDTLFMKNYRGVVSKYLKVDSEKPNKFNILPYESYLYDSRYNTFYPIRTATMKADHGTGTLANFKFLILRAEYSESLLPTGIMFNYSTPYYEGINREWGEGSYQISRSGGYHTYGITMCYIGGYDASNMLDGGTLNISKNSSYMVIDYKDKGGTLVHFVGKVQ